MCGRAIGFGQRITYSGIRYGLRGALHFHQNDSHYTAVVCRGNKYYECNNTTITPITRSQAFNPYTYGDRNTVQALMYSRILSD